MNLSYLQYILTMPKRINNSNKNKELDDDWIKKIKFGALVRDPKEIDEATCYEEYMNGFRAYTAEFIKTRNLDEYTDNLIKEANNFNNNLTEIDEKYNNNEDNIEPPKKKRKTK